MKKLICAVLAVCMLLSLTACGATNGETDAEFRPALDTEASCNITVVGSYDNFEALEAEFDRFNHQTLTPSHIKSNHSAPPFISKVL